MSTPLPHSRVRVQRIAEAAVERARLTVVPRVRARSPRVPFVTLVSLLLVGGVVGLLMFNTTMQQNSFAATELEQHASDLTSREQTLRMELEVLRDPQVVAEKARALGMVDAGAPAFLKADGSVEGVTVPATALNKVPILPPAVKKPAALDPKPIIVFEKPGRKKTGDTDRASRGERDAGRRMSGTRTTSGDRSTR
jgi:hypothetical protein